MTRSLTPQVCRLLQPLGGQIGRFDFYRRGTESKIPPITKIIFAQEFLSLHTSKDWNFRTFLASIKSK